MAARRKVAKAKAGERAPRVYEGVIKDARGMITVGPEHQLWDESVRTTVEAESFYVRLRPPAEATDYQIAQLRANFEKAGALAVVVYPRPKAQTVTKQQEASTRAAHKSIRGLVEEMVREANTPDREALETITQKTMAKVGL